MTAESASSNRGTHHFVEAPEVIGDDLLCGSVEDLRGLLGGLGHRHLILVVGEGSGD